MNNGWIKIHRQIQNWEWYTTPNMLHGLVHLMLTCNHEDKKWRGIMILRGETIQSLETLANTSGLSVSQWRTILKNLKSTQSLTERRHGKFRILKLEKYNDYQINDTIVDNEIAGRSQGDRSKQEYKNIRNKELTNTTADAVGDFDNDEIDTIFNDYIAIVGRTSVSKVVRAKYRARVGKFLKEFGRDKMLRAWRAMTENPWLMGENPNNVKYCHDLAYAFRAEKLEEYMLKGEPEERKGIKPMVFEETTTLIPISQ